MSAANASADQVADVLAERLEEAGLLYAFGGALALAAWGVPRATVDVDVSVFVPIEEIDQVFDVLDRTGAIVDRASATRDADQMGMFVARLRGARLDIFLAHHPMHESMERRRVPIRAFGNHERYFLSAEDVVLTKLIYRRPKDLIDLERLFAVQSGRLDLDYVRDWLARITGSDDPRHALLDELESRFQSD